MRAQYIAVDRWVEQTENMLHNNSNGLNALMSTNMRLLALHF